MRAFRRLSLVEQTAAHLREGLRAGRWRGQLPGAVRLAAELGVSINTLRPALRIVEAEGLVKLGENGRSRHVPARVARRQRPLRIGILLFEPLALEVGQPIEIGVRHSLEATGFTVFFSSETQCGLGHDVRRIARYVKREQADAWVVCSASRAVLKWFAAQPQPALAEFGDRAGLPMAAVGLDKLPALLDATRLLIALGHRRIVYICRRVQRVPELHPNVSAMLAELVAHGCLSAGDYNLPEWEETTEGLHALFDALFRVTPPTALFFDETPIALAAQQFLAGRGIKVPEQVSLVTEDYDACFRFYQPSIAHTAWRSEPIVHRIVQWATAISQHRPDLRQVNFPAEFIPGGTIGPVWKR